jgi:hypothetical protein
MLTDATTTKFFLNRLRLHSLAALLTVACLYVPLFWLAFDFNSSPYSGVLILAPAYLLSGLSSLKFVTPIICSLFLAVAFGVIRLSLTRNKNWLIVGCFVVVCFSTLSSRQIFLNSKPILGLDISSEMIQSKIYLEIFHKQ